MYFCNYLNKLLQKPKSLHLTKRPALNIILSGRLFWSTMFMFEKAKSKQLYVILISEN
jgi:hypothetical protein